MEAPVFVPSDLLAILKRRKWCLILPFAIISASVLVLALALPPIYKSTSTILIEQQDIPAEFVKATISTYADQQLQIINQRIMSTTRLLDIINRFDLYPDQRGKEPIEEMIVRMRSDITLEPISIDVVDPKTGRPTTATIAFTLSYEGKNDPQKVYQIANVLASLFLEENVRTREQQAGEVSKFLEAELGKVKSDLARIDADIARFKEKNIGGLPELIGVNMQSVNDIDRNIDTLSNQKAQLQEREVYLQTQLASTPAEFRETDRERLSELKVQLVNLRQRFSDEHPDVKKTKTEIAEIEKNLKAGEGVPKENMPRPDNPAYITLASQLSSVRSEMKSVESQIADLRQRGNKYKKLVSISPQVESSYKALAMERVNTQAKYDDLMRKLMEAKVSQGLEKEQKGERFTIIDPARLPEEPYKPNRMAIVLIGLVLSIGAGIGTAAVKEYSDGTVRSADLLAMVTSLPVLASIPHILTGRDIALRKTRLTAWIVGSAVVAIMVVAAFHFFVMDLDIFWAKLVRRMGI
jgi:polysaccharide chain length determinant protein (PEP-CTERM system associated)